MALRLMTKPNDCIIYQLKADAKVVQGTPVKHSNKSGWAFAIDGGKKATTVAYCLSAPYVQATVQGGQNIAPGDDVFVSLDGSGLARKTTTAGYTAEAVGYCVNSYDTTSNEGEIVTIRWASARET